MFRIKTDIRQYKCETQEKVEKLIRNWVIRPNDLIYSADEQAWLPIGEHPAFVALFALLDEQMRAEPDTVVTPDPQERSRARTSGHARAATPHRARRELVFADAEVTRVQARSAQAALLSEPLAIPEPPEGVEGVLRSSDEITVMTERTLDLMGVDEGADEEGAAEEVRDDADATLERRGLARHELPEELFATAEISSPVLDESDEPPLDELGELEAALEGDEAQADVDPDRTKVAAKPSRWRIRIDERFKAAGDEPGQAGEEPASSDDEDLRQTNELTEEEARSIARLREKQRAEEQRAEEQRAEKSAGEEAAEASVSGADDDDELVVAEPIGKVAAPRDALVGEAPQVEAADVEAADVEAAEVEAAEVEVLPIGERPADGEASDEPDADDAPGDDSDDADDADPDLDDADPDDADPDDADLDDDGEWDDDEWEDDEHVDVATPIAPAPRTQNLDFVSDGYNVPLPFEVRPSDADAARGLKQTNVSRAEKDRAFPTPRPQKPGKVVMHTYRLVPEPPRDRSLVVYVAIAAVVVVVIAIAAAL